MNRALVGIMTVIALPGAAVAVPCSDARTSLEHIDRAVQSVEESWTSMDTAGVQAAESDVLGRVACVDQPLSPQLAARVHRGVGLVAVTRGNQELAARSFAAARLASDQVQMTAALAPPGSPVARLYARPIQELPAIPLQEPRRGLLLVDGSPVEALPAARPLILQHMARDGNVLGSWWLESAARLPLEPWSDPRRNTRRALRFGGLVGVGLGGAAWGIAAANHAAHRKPDVIRTAEQLDGLRDASRAGTVAGAGLLAVGSTAFGLSFTGALQ